MKNIKYIIGLVGLFFTFNSYAQYTLQDDDVIILNYFITALTEKGIQNVKDTSIIIPQQLQGQNIIGIGRDVFLEKGLKGTVQLPSKIEYIGKDSFRGNENMIYPNFKELTNLKIIEAWSFHGVSDKYSDKLDFSNLAKLEKIDYLSFVLSGIDSIKELDFSNCTNLKSIGQMAFLRMKSINQFDKINFSNCENLSYIDFGNFAFKINEIDTINAITTQIDFTNCKSLIYIAPWVFGIGKQQMESLIPKLPTPEINNVTFSKWVIYNYNLINMKPTYCLLATFKEKVISVKKVGEGGFSWTSKSKPQTYQDLLSTLNKLKTKSDQKEVTFQITNHSVNDVEISNIVCNLEHCTLSWQNGTIKTGETQTVTVTYPDTTTNYTATINIEGENLMGNTTVNVGKKGSVTTDDNLLSSIIAQQEILQKDDITVYPNPATDELHINFANPQTTNQITILNLQGKTVYENLNFKGSVINISKLPPAVYVMKVNGAVKSFVKQ